MKWLENFLKGKWLKHPLHPVLAHIPAAAWPGALVFDALSQTALGGNAMVQLSFYAIVLGLAASALAVPTGLADWSDIKKDKPAWKIGLYHMALNLLAVLIFAVNVGLRLPTFREASAVAAAPFALSAFGTLLVLISAYLGGLMVFDHGIGVARQSKKKWRKMAEAGGSNVPPEQNL